MSTEARPELPTLPPCPLNTGPLSVGLRAQLSLLAVQATELRWVTYKTSTSPAVLSPQSQEN